MQMNSVSIFVTNPNKSAARARASSTSTSFDPAADDSFLSPFRPFSLPLDHLRSLAMRVLSSRVHLLRFNLRVLAAAFDLKFYEH